MLSSPSSTSPLIIFKGAEGSASSPTSSHYTAKHYPGRHPKSPAPGKVLQPTNSRSQQWRYHEKGADRAIRDGHSGLRQAPITPFQFDHTTPQPLESFSGKAALQAKSDQSHKVQPHSSGTAVIVPAGIRNQTTADPAASATTVGDHHINSDYKPAKDGGKPTSTCSAVGGEGQANRSLGTETDAAIAAEYVNTHLASPNASSMAQKRPSPYSLAEITRQNDVAAAPLTSPTNHATSSTTATATAANPASSSSTNKKQHFDQVAAAASSEQEAQPSSKRRRSQPNAPKILPRDYSLVDPSDLVILISSMLMELIQYNDKIPLRDGRLTRFHSRSPPRIGVQQYLERLTIHATLSPPILLSMVYYIDRLCALYPTFTISSLTVHRFLICAATVASKGLSDSFWSNKTYAKVGGISMEELALLELELLFKVEWRIVPRPEVLVDYYLSLVERCDGYELEHSSPRRALKDGLHGEASGEESSDDSSDSSSSSDDEDEDDEANFTDSKAS